MGNIVFEVNKEINFGVRLRQETTKIVCTGHLGDIKGTVSLFKSWTECNLKREISSILNE